MLCTSFSVQASALEPWGGGRGGASENLEEVLVSITVYHVITEVVMLWKLFKQLLRS